jgi:hypothetical protein
LQWFPPAAPARKYGDEQGFRNLFSSRAGFSGIFDLRFHAMRALGSQGNGNRNQLAVLHRDAAIVSLRDLH